MTGSRRLRRTLGFGLLGIAALTVAVPAVALIRNTTAHDWYAARKVTVADVMIGAGFDRFAQSEYRTADGVTGMVTRYDIFFNGEALWARARILDTIAGNAMLGAGAGFGGAILFLAGFWSAGRSRRGRAEAPAARAPAAWAGPKPGSIAQAKDAGCIARPAAAAPAAQADRAPAPPAPPARPRAAPEAKQAAGTPSKSGSPERASDVAPAAPAADDSGRNAGARSPARRRPRRYERWA